MKCCLSFFLCVVVFFGCQEGTALVTETSESILANELSVEVVDSIIKPNDSAQPTEMITLDVTAWTIDEFIVDCPKEMKAELIDYLRYERAEWQGVSNPFIATYDGNDFGDYFHVMFTDDKDKSYDFGFADKDFGGIALYTDDEQMTDNPEYLGKAFNITWEWKVSSFPCCSGGYEMVQAYLPSIVNLELMEDDTRSREIGG